eukprot:TRINITY_DN288_c3_g1_i1.p1 TRINITY_DN288_c3_g1~~TRINITY_DN288_c3_g1_i1.p1  ORF type:complete len:258 (-),score=63.44 TRINITY_DN288_c3_g1_i1:90-863(-)
MPPPEYQLVKYKHGKLTFEVLCKVGTALKYRDGKLGIDNTLISDDIFTHAQKGEKAKASDLQAAFGTEKIADCIKTIMDKGEIQLSTEERKEMQQQKLNEVVNYIHKYYSDPKTKTSIPVTRIQNALETLKFHADPDLPVDRQLPDILKRLPEVLPCSKQEFTGIFIIPSHLMGQAGGVLKKHCNIQSEKFDGDNCRVRVSFVPGDYDPLMMDVNRATKGEAQFQAEDGATAASAPAAAAAAAPAAAASSAKKKGKK